VSGCYASGGPQWLFSVALGGGMAGAFGLVTVLAPGLLVDPSAAGRPRRSGWDRGLPLLALLPLVFLGIAHGGGPDFSVLLWAIVPLAVITAAGAIDRRARGTSARRGLPAKPRRTWSFALGCLALAAAFAAVVAMIVQGHPC
jgi:hypothetical protein